MDKSQRWHVLLVCFLSFLSDRHIFILEISLKSRIKLLLPPSINCETFEDDEGDSSVLIRTKAMQRGVLVLPGECSFFDERRTAYVRVSFSLLNDEDTDEALRRLASVLREEWNEVCDSD